MPANAQGVTNPNAVVCWSGSLLSVGPCGGERRRRTPGSFELAAGAVGPEIQLSPPFAVNFEWCHLLSPDSLAV